MKKRFIILFGFVTIFTFTLTAQQLQSPSEFLGYELGTQFTRHHKVVDYFTYISKQSELVILEQYGKTTEGRPLYLSFISSIKNIQNLETIRTDNLKRARIVEGNSTSEIGIVWLSYNVHGNEASSTEAAMLSIYKLLTENQEWLQNTVVIMDPCINPDGRDRYVNWYNQTKSTPYNSDPNTTEHKEPWPGGRPNHYLFDLNRDWAWATQVETQQRLKVYNLWMPHIHVDFHEQGHNSPYYFAPAAEPFHEIITDWQREFQIKIGKNHAKYFDAKGWRYFTKESFDLLYPSYGDTYPTYMGAIGMTYEQAGHGRAGLGIITENGTELTLKDRIAHHTTTGLSTVETSSKNTSKMLEEFEKFFDNKNMKTKSYIVRGSNHKLKSLLKLLDKHEIHYFPAESKSVKVFDYAKNQSNTIKTSMNDIAIPTNQPKGKMVKVLFDFDTKLSINKTYDITSWSLPFAYGLEGFSTQQEIASNKTFKVDKSKIAVDIDFTAYAYIHKWNEVADAQFLGDLLEEGFNVRFSKKDFIIEGKSYTKGSLIILKGENKHIQNFGETIQEISNRLGQEITATQSGFVDSGADFGSSSVSLIKNKKIAVLSGEGTSPYSFGEIWHLFETQLKYPLAILNTKSLNYLNLSEYEVLILPDGYEANEKSLKKLSDFVSKGGTLIAISGALNSFADKDGFSLKTKKEDKSKEKKQPNLTPYAQRENEYLKNMINGSIFKSHIDNTHPLGFGYTQNYFSLKRNGTSFELLEKGYNVGYLPKDTKNISGFSGKEALKNVGNSLLFGVEQKGKGRIIYMVDNPLFRSFWENGKLFFVNAVFLN